MGNSGKIKGKSEWKRCILELSDDLFFSIMRTYLGEVQTPFHKPRLVDRLAVFLTEEETLRRIIALIDRFDAEVLTAIEILEQPDPATLYRFFQEEREYFNFHNHLVNLQERLLIFTCPESSELYLNPYIAPELQKKILTPRQLFPPADPAPSVKNESSGNPPVLFTEELVWSLLSFLLHRNDLFRNDGTFRKKTADQLLQSFPGLTPGGDFSGLTLLIHGLQKTGMLEIDPGEMKAVFRMESHMEKLSRPLRLCALWAAVTLGEPPSEGHILRIKAMPPTEIEESALHFLRFLKIIPGGRIFSRTSIHRFMFMSGLQQGQAFSLEDSQLTTLVNRLCELRLLLRHGDHTFLNPELPELLRQEPNPKPLLLHPDFSVTVKPPLSYSAGRFIAFGMQIKTYGTYPQFELTSDAFLSARDHYGFEDIKEQISALSGSPVPQNISFSLQAWENNYSSVFMMEGIILILAEHWSRLAHHHPEFRRHVLRDLENGIFVMDPGTLGTWRRILQEIGVSPLPPVRLAETHTTSRRENQEVGEEPLRMSVESSPRLDLSLDFPREGSASDGGAGIQEELTGAMEHLETKSGEEKELISRIEHKLYLFPRQLSYPVLSDPASEARGIDYAGKVRVIQQALRSRGALLELVERTSGGKPARHLVRPMELHKSGSDLVLQGRRLPLEEELKIRVEKIGYIKKWKSSLFIQPGDYTPS